MSSKDAIKQQHYMTISAIVLSATFVVMSAKVKLMLTALRKSSDNGPKIDLKHGTENRSDRRHSCCY